MNIPSTAAAAGSPRPKPAPSATGSVFAGAGAVGVGLAGGEDVAVVMVDDEVTGRDCITVMVVGKEAMDAVAARRTPSPAAQHEVLVSPQHQLPSPHFSMPVELPKTPTANHKSKLVSHLLGR
jgi:hypothetical protein